MNLKLSRRYLLPLFGLMLSVSFQASAEDPSLRKDKSQGSLDEIVQALIDAPWPLGFDYFRRVGIAEFKQQGSSNADPIVFRSGPVETSDGYRIAYTEFRIPPRLVEGINFYYGQLEEGRCYPAARLKEKYALERFIYPPNPHNAVAERTRRQSGYQLRSSGTVLHFTADGSDDDCLVSFYRSTR